MERRKIFTLVVLATFCLGVSVAYIDHRISKGRRLVIDVSQYPTIGSDRAKIEIVVFEDLLCPSCRIFSMEVIPLLIPAYVERGIVRLTMIPVALFPASKLVANAALAIFSQSPKQFFSFVQQLCLNFPLRAPEETELYDLVKKMEEIDFEQAAASMKMGRFDTQLNLNLELARSIMQETMSVPAVFFNGFRMKESNFEAIASKIEKDFSNSNVYHK